MSQNYICLLILNSTLLLFCRFKIYIGFTKFVHKYSVSAIVINLEIASDLFKSL